MIHGDILNNDQVRVMMDLNDLPTGSYMAGGTALALQLKHRTSFDFDFYVNFHFDPEALLKKIESVSNKVVVERIVKDTLLLDIDGVSFSMFYYPYKLIRPSVPYKNIILASIEDIAAMKLIAVSMRGKRRDFIDIYYLLKKDTLDQLIKFALEKYPSYQPMVILKGLLYFNDAEDEDLSRGIKVLDPDFSWEKAKKRITEEVRKYQGEVAP